MAEFLHSYSKQVSSRKERSSGIAVSSALHELLESIVYTLKCTQTYRGVLTVAVCKNTLKRKMTDFVDTQLNGDIHLHPHMHPSLSLTKSEYSFEEHVIIICATNSVLVINSWCY